MGGCASKDQPKPVTEEDGTAAQDGKPASDGVVASDGTNGTVDGATDDANAGWVPRSATPSPRPPVRPSGGPAGPRGCSVGPARSSGVSHRLPGLLTLFSESSLSDTRSAPSSFVLTVLAWQPRRRRELGGWVGLGRRSSQRTRLLSGPLRVHLGSCALAFFAFLLFLCHSRHE